MVVDRTGRRPRIRRDFAVAATAPIIVARYLFLIDRANPLSRLRPSSMGWRRYAPTRPEPPAAAAPVFILPSPYSIRNVRPLPADVGGASHDGANHPLSGGERTPYPLPRRRPRRRAAEL